MSGQNHASSALTLEIEPPNTHRTECWMGPRAGLDDTEKRKSVASAENETLIPPILACILVTTSTELSRLIIDVAMLKGYNCTMWSGPALP
jgi:hypothetical protein